MAAIAPILASKAFLGATAAVSAAGTAVSIQQGRRAQAAQEKADKAGQAAAEIANQRNIRRGILQSRALQAQAISTGAAGGGGFGGSATQGAAGSIATQGAANVGFAKTQIGAQNAINQLQSQARGAASNAQTFGAIAALPGQFGFDVGSVFKTLEDKPGVT